jgi:hypothetical protein
MGEVVNRIVCRSKVKIAGFSKIASPGLRPPSPSGRGEGEAPLVTAGDAIGNGGQIHSNREN